MNAEVQTPDTQRPMLSGRDVPVLVLLAAHVPFVAIYYWRLWDLEHYRFFPFALGIFFWQLLTRRQADATVWRWYSKCLVVVDLICLIGAVALPTPSPWLATTGMILLLSAWALASREENYRQSLGTLALLPLMTLRLPGLMDEDLIHWLQRVTTSISSGALHLMGMLHYREGNILKFPDKSFLVEEACSGVNSVFTILFVATLVICLRQRAFLHGLCLLCLGLLFAGGMNVVRILTIALAWDRYKYDLSTGTSHETLGYVCLAVAAILLLSADAFLHMLTAPVPNVMRPGAVLKNPFIKLWNRWLTVVPVSGLVHPAVEPSLTAKWRKVNMGICGLAILLQAWLIKSGGL